MPLIVKATMMSGETLTYPTSSKAVVKDLKERLKVHLDVPKRNIDLFWRDVQLECDILSPNGVSRPQAKDAVSYSM